jgi:pimeloyl-ACP methyl ester carboxylesterase
MRRCDFMGAATGASLGLLLESRFAEFARAGNPAGAGLGQSAFGSSQVEVSGNTIFLRRYGKGPGILLVHGLPRTRLMWRFIAPGLAENHTVICVDLRAYGRSASPLPPTITCPTQSGRWPKSWVEMMDKHAFSSFTLIGHDRGGRVSYRLALDHAKHVERVAVFDVIPILEAWSRCDARFAQTYWPWILLSQKEPLPENYLLGALDSRSSLAPDAHHRDPTEKPNPGSFLASLLLHPLVRIPGALQLAHIDDLPGMVGVVSRDVRDRRSDLRQRPIIRGFNQIL